MPDIRDAETIIDPVYLPFTPSQLGQHFVSVARGGDPTVQTAYYRKSAEYRREYLQRKEAGLPSDIRATGLGWQMEKDERFWVAATLMALFHDPNRISAFTHALQLSLGDEPPFTGPATWEEALGAHQNLFFEVQLPSPLKYCDELAKCPEEHMLAIPYLKDEATKRIASRKKLEGPTHVDAILIADTGFAVLFEAKVLSDASCRIEYDVVRNQIARNIDVMLQPNPNLQKPLTQRLPERTCFVLITPEIFRDHPESRLYGWLMRDYQHHPAALRRDLPHRTGTDFASIASRLGWLSWEDCNRVLPGACPWLSARPAGIG